jgi:hypothetical protein
MKNWKSILKNERSKFYCVYSLLWWRSERFNAPQRFGYEPLRIEK